MTVYKNLRRFKYITYYNRFGSCSDKLGRQVEVEYEKNMKRAEYERMLLPQITFLLIVAISIVFVLSIFTNYKGDHYLYITGHFTRNSMFVLYIVYVYYPITIRVLSFT